MTDEINELRKLQDRHDDVLAELDIQLREGNIELEKSKERVKFLESEKENDGVDNDDWVKKVYSNMSLEGRKDFRNAFTVAAPSLKRGTISRLRRTTGLTFRLTQVKLLKKKAI